MDTRSVCHEISRTGVEAHVAQLRAGTPCTRTARARGISTHAVTDKGHIHTYSHGQGAYPHIQSRTRAYDFRLAAGQHPRTRPCMHVHPIFKNCSWRPCNHEAVTACTPLRTSPPSASSSAAEYTPRGSLVAERRGRDHPQCRPMRGRLARARVAILSWLSHPKHRPLRPRAHRGRKPLWLRTHQRHYSSRPSVRVLGLTWRRPVSLCGKPGPRQRESSSPAPFAVQRTIYKGWRGGCVCGN